MLPNMQDVILERMEAVLPKVPDSALNYLLGYGDGLAEGMNAAKKQE